MQWYVSNEGNVAGPLSADEVREGIADGSIEAGMHVRDEHGQWGPIDQSPFAGLLPQTAGASSWYLNIDGTVTGPFAGEEMAAAVSSGHVPRDALLSLDRVEWVQAGQSAFAEWFPPPRPVPIQREETLTGWWVVIGLAAVAGGWMVYRAWEAQLPKLPPPIPTTKFVYTPPPSPPPEPPEEAIPRIATTSGRWCRVLLTSDQRSPVPVVGGQSSAAGE
jgi:GYF domain 2